MMNRTITTILVMLCVSLCAFAQKGLRINDVFEGKVILKSKMQESLIKGDNLASYNLKVLHTVKFTTPFKLRREEVEKLFYEDMENQISTLPSLPSSNICSGMRPLSTPVSMISFTDWRENCLLR